VDESSAVAVIVTPESIESPFVTYECARAMGNGIEVVPLLFRSISHDLKHPVLERIQWIDCRTIDESAQIRNKVITQLRHLEQVSSFAWILGRSIGEIAMPFRIFSSLATWLYPFTQFRIVDHEEFRFLVTKALHETLVLYAEKLSQLWLNSSSAFSHKQKKYFGELIRRLEEYWHVYLRELVFQTQTGGWTENGAFHATQVDKYRREKIDPLFILLSATVPPYESFSAYLEKVSDASVTKQTLQDMRFYTFFENAINRLDSSDAAYIRGVLEKMESNHPVE
jgi:hypothetical protein